MDTQEAQDAIWAARKSAATFHEVGFRKGLSLAVKALTDQASALKSASKGSDSGVRAQVLKETAALCLQVAGVLRKIKPGEHS